MKLSTLALTLAVAVTGPVLAADAPSPVTANIGVVSNYIWRGLTQTKDGAAVQGGLDYANDSGFSLGTWVSNVAAPTNYEMDLYGGYGIQAGDFGYKLKTTYYAYPDAHKANFWELEADATWNILTLGVAYTLDGQPPKGNAYRQGDFYYFGNLNIPLNISDLSLGATLGHTNFKDLGSNGDYTNWRLSLSKDAKAFGTFSLNYDQIDGGSNNTFATDSDPKFSVGWLKTF